jgi:co-chaperonin GroES (HSP10)
MPTTIVCTACSGQGEVTLPDGATQLCFTCRGTGRPFEPELQLIGDIVAVRPWNPGRTRGGLLVPESAKEEVANYRHGTVVKVGPGHRSVTGAMIPGPDLEVGDEVLYAPSYAHKFRYGGEELELIDPGGIFAKERNREEQK